MITAIILKISMLIPLQPPRILLPRRCHRACHPVPLGQEVAKQHRQVH